MKRLFTPLAPALAPLLLLAACDKQPEKPSQPAAEGAPPAAQAVPSASTSASAAPDVSGRVSRYTSLKDCSLLREEEGQFSLSRCPGEGDYGLLVADGDARENIVIETGRHRGLENGISLDLSQYTSGGFTSLGDTVEWRGPAGASFRPDVLVIRYSVTENAEEPGKPTSYLLAFALRGEKPCLIAKVAPGAGQSESIRAAADGPLACKAP